MKRKLSKWKRTPPFILNWLSYDKDVDVRYNVAENPNTTRKILDRLYYDKGSLFREYVAKNPNTQPETLERLSYDKDHWVRYYVSKNPNTPQYILDLNKFSQFLKWYKDPTDDPKKELS